MGRFFDRRPFEFDPRRPYGPVGVAYSIDTTGEIKVENHWGVSILSIEPFAWAIHSQGDGHA
ncbi:MAG: hypothetical protein K0U61_10885 [Alphaproteobacteria bacterium]|nr:hypothetical protein [Alphaproteobacteria bacterium]